MRDFTATGSGLGKVSQSHSMFYNLRPLEDLVDLLRDAFMIFAFGEMVSMIHGRIDIPTPRGSSLAIRPTLEYGNAWLTQAGFHSVPPVVLQDIFPYHFGLTAIH